jgi:threonine/homoserine/homoserine lactone efflux protein
MVPLALANVLLNDLLARPASKLLLAVCVFILAAGYVLTLIRFHSSLVSVLQIMGACNLLLLGVCAWFSWGAKKGGMPRE